jgi:peptidoglycan/LPS O-acetylase OafA/YrhL
MMVLCGHVYAQSPLSPAPIRNLVVGVDIFFVLSGYLITTLILKEYRLTTAFSFKQFIFRRLLRILPAYYLLLLLLFVAGLLAGPSVEWTQPLFYELPWHATFLSNLIVSNSVLEITWSLSTEEQFYLIWPMIFYLYRRKVALITLLLFTSINIGFLVSGADVFFNIHEYHLAQTTFFPLCLGCILAFVLDNPSTFDYIRKSLKNKFCTATILGLIAVLLLCGAEEWSGLIRVGYNLLVSAFIAACIIEPQHSLSAILNSAFFSRVGKISYGIYLFHGIAINTFRPLLWPLDAVLIMSAGSSMLFAELCYRCVESPFLRLKARTTSSIST